MRRDAATNSLRNSAKTHMSQRQIHVSVDQRFHEVFLAALKRLRYKTQAEFFRAKMREAIEEAECKDALAARRR